MSVRFHPLGCRTPLPPFWLDSGFRRNDGMKWLTTVTSLPGWQTSSSLSRMTHGGWLYASSFRPSAARAGIQFASAKNSISHNQP